MSDQQPPQGDQPHGQPSYDPQPYGQQPSYGQPSYGQQPYQPFPPQGSSSRATTSLVLGIVSLVACGLFTGIPAMVLASRAKREIKASGGRIGGEGLATAGFWTGLVGTVWMGLATLLVIGVFVFGGVVRGSFQESCTVTSGDSTADCS